jgi:ribosomal protein S18 acetylase RimI-like enzyme
VRDYVVPSGFSAIAARLSFEALSRDPGEWEELCRLLGDDTFGTDRVALDPLFNRGIAKRRYKNWLRDMRENSSALAARIKYGEKTIGFFALSLDAEHHTAHVLLSGLFREYQGQALGGTIIHVPLAASAERGITRFSTAISSNNFPVFQ